jgi:hypothetical protein
MLQSIVFDKDHWSLKSAKSWLKKHKYKVGLDEKPNSYRFRQSPVKKNVRYYTKTIYHYKKPIYLIEWNDK